jgi:hypothetical protein
MKGLRKSRKAKEINHLSSKPLGDTASFESPSKPSAKYYNWIYEFERALRSIEAGLL